MYSNKDKSKVVVEHVSTKVDDSKYHVHFHGLNLQSQCLSNTTASDKSKEKPTSSQFYTLTSASAKFAILTERFMRPELEENHFIQKDETTQRRCSCIVITSFHVLAGASLTIKLLYLTGSSKHPICRNVQLQSI